MSLLRILTSDLISSGSCRDRQDALRFSQSVGFDFSTLKCLASAGCFRHRLAFDLLEAMSDIPTFDDSWESLQDDLDPQQSVANVGVVDVQADQLPEHEVDMPVDTGHMVDAETIASLYTMERHCDVCGQSSEDNAVSQKHPLVTAQVNLSSRMQWRPHSFEKFLSLI